MGLDVSKLKISVAVAVAGRDGEVRFYGDISSSPAVVSAMIKKLAKPGVRLHFCYEAGPMGYELHRQIRGGARVRGGGAFAHSQAARRTGQDQPA